MEYLSHRTDDQGNIVRWFCSSTDIDDQKRAEDALWHRTDKLRRSEFYLAEGQRLAHMGADGKPRMLGRRAF